MSTQESAIAVERSSTRKKALTAVTGIVIVGAIASASYWALVLNHY